MVVFFGVAEQLIVVELDNKRDFVGVFSRGHSHYAKGGCNGITAASDRQINDVFQGQNKWDWEQKKPHPNVLCLGLPEGWKDSRYWRGDPYHTAVEGYGGLGDCDRSAKKIRLTQSGPGKFSWLLSTLAL